MHPSHTVGSGGGLRPYRHGDRDHLLFLPSRPPEALLVAFHPFGATPELVIDGGVADGYLIRPLDGVRAPADALGMAVLLPRSRGRAVPGVSLAWGEHLDATWDAARDLLRTTGARRLFVGGLSMGGMESLAFAARHPDEVDGAWASNPIVDLAAWHRDLTNSTESGGRELADVIETEVGGTPAESPEEYASRSPIQHATRLARTRVLLSWSPADTVIPHQRASHAGALGEAIRRAGGSVEERIVTHAPREESLDAGRFAHEACDVWEALGWCASLPATSR